MEKKKRIVARTGHLRRWIAAAAIGLMAVVVGAPSALAQSSESVEGQTYVIGTDTTFAPFEFRQDGELTGIDMDLLRAIAEDQGFEVEIRSLGFNAALAA
ncbi:transporter substrate-binding domain-containing protein, partial [Glutamicibacter arilaitensis]